MASANLAAVRAHFAAGRSVCPFAKTAPVVYARDADPLAPLLAKLEPKMAAVIVADDTPAGFEATRAWARTTFMAALAGATVVSFPSFVGPERDRLLARLRRELHDDAAPARPMIGLREQPLVTICMAPIYPAKHPRYAPGAALVLVHVADVDGIELPAVRRAMQDEHGLVYDANELMLELPKLAASS